MQANNDIKNLFEGFENEFGKGDWGAIESQVLANNKKYRAKKFNFKLGIALSTAACLVLGFVHFGSINLTVETETQTVIPEDNSPKKGVVIPINTDDELLEEKTLSTENSIEAPIRATVAESVREAKEIQTTPVAFVQKENVVVMPDFVFEKKIYCLGEKVSFDHNKSIEKELSVKFNKKKLSIDKFKKLRFNAVGSNVVEILRKGQVIGEYKLNVEAPMASIGYNKSYDVNNPYVSFKAMNSVSKANYNWYVDNEPVSSTSQFEHTFPSKGIYRIKMVVQSNSGCKDSSVKSVRILRGYNLMATSIFNPEKDKSWMPMGLKKEGIKFKLRIVNQDGKTIFTSKDANREWDGKTVDENLAGNGDLFYWVAQVEDVNGRISEYGNSLLINSNLQ